MKRKKSIVVLFLVIMTTIVSCKKEQSSLQKYFIESHQKENFLSFDLSTNMIQSYLNNSDNQIKEVLKTVHKINIIALPIKDNKEQYELEKQHLNSILSNTTVYKSLVKVKNDKLKIDIYYKGKPNNVNEIVVCGSTDGVGLGVVRLLGDNMDTEKMMEVVQKIKVDNPEAIEIQEALKKQL